MLLLRHLPQADPALGYTLFISRRTAARERPNRGDKRSGPGAAQRPFALV